MKSNCEGSPGRKAAWLSSSAGPRRHPMGVSVRVSRCPQSSQRGGRGPHGVCGICVVTHVRGSAGGRGEEPTSSYVLFSLEKQAIPFEDRSRTSWPGTSSQDWK